MAKFYEIGCRKCGDGGNWTLFSDGNGHFKLKHVCGHESKFSSNAEVVENPDMISYETCQDCKKPTAGGILNMKTGSLSHICYDCAVKRGYKEPKIKGDGKI